MRWIATEGFENGSRWDLFDGQRVLGRVFRCVPEMEVDVVHYDSQADFSGRFKTMKEAAEWLVKRVTTGTGAL
jgi:hypothetical protein